LIETAFELGLLENDDGEGVGNYSNDAED